MEVKDVMTHPVETAFADTNLYELAHAMRSNKIGAIPIRDTAWHVVGMVTDRDLVLRGIADGRDPQTTKAEEVMSKNVISCFEDDPLFECMLLMETHGIRRIPVLNSEQQVVGIVSLDDLAVHAGDSAELQELLYRVAWASTRGR
jgi:CBS domain-containing protein